MRGILNQSQLSQQTKVRSDCRDQQYIINSLPNVIDNPSEDSSFSTKGEIQAKGKNLKMSGEQATPKYTIGCHSGDYITLTLHNQREDYRKFLIEERGLCDDIKSSVAANITITNLLLGWLRREKIYHWMTCALSRLFHC